MFFWWSAISFGLNRLRGRPVRVEGEQLSTRIATPLPHSFLSLIRQWYWSAQVQRFISRSTVTGGHSSIS